MLQGFRNSVAYHIRLFPGCINENSYAALSDVHVHHIAQKTLDAVVGHVHHYVEIDIQDPDSVLQIDRIFLFWGTSSRLRQPQVHAFDRKRCLVVRGITWNPTRSSSNSTLPSMPERPCPHSRQ